MIDSYYGSHPNESMLLDGKNASPVNRLLTRLPEATLQLPKFEDRYTKPRGEGPFPLWLSQAPVPRARFTEALGGLFP